MPPTDDDQPEGQPPEVESKVHAFFRAPESAVAGANDDALQIRLSLLLQEHSDLDAAITALAGSASHDRLAVARLKKKKLKLKDLIEAVKERMTPDIIA